MLIPCYNCNCHAAARLHESTQPQTWVNKEFDFPPNHPITKAAVPCSCLMAQYPIAYYTQIQHWSPSATTYY